MSKNSDETVDDHLKLLMCMKNMMKTNIFMKSFKTINRKR